MKGVDHIINVKELPVMLLDGKPVDFELVEGTPGKTDDGRHVVTLTFIQKPLEK